MNALQSIQSRFQQYVLDDAPPTPELEAALASQRGLAKGERLAIYHNAYRARMREALGDAYPRTWTYAGDDLFGELAGAYLAEYGSSFNNLRWFGDCFASFLRRQLPDLPHVAELAAFEWALGLAFDAPDADVAGIDTFRNLAPDAWGALVLKLQPSVQLLHMEFNSVALWQAMGDEVEPPPPLALTAPCTWLVWRKEQQPHFRSLDPFEAEALAALADGCSFGQICEQGRGDDAAARMGRCLHEWMGQSLLRT